MDSSIFFGDKRLGLTVLLLIVVGIAIIGCGKDAPLSPEEETFLSQEEAKTALVGIWQRTFSTGIVDIGTTYSNRLAFTEDGSYGYSSKKGVYNEGPEIKLGTYSVLKNVISVVAIDSLVVSAPGSTYTATFSISYERPQKLTLSGPGYFISILPTGVYERRR